MNDPVKELFQSVRSHDHRVAPRFDEVVAQRPRRQKKLDVMSLAGLGIAAALVFMAWPRHMEVGTMTLSSMTWRTPTDTLLATPGRDILREMPDLHESILNLQGSP